MIISRSICVAANGNISCFLMTNILLYIWNILYPSISGLLGCFHILAVGKVMVVNNAGVNIGVHISFRIRVFIFSGYMPRSGITGSYGSSIFSFFKVTASIYIPTKRESGEQRFILLCFKV